MNTPMTNELEKLLLESSASSDLGKFQRMTGHARWFETQLIAEQEKVRELREALEFIAAGNCERAIQARNTARAILEKTK